MRVVHFKDAETCEPQVGWLRKSMCNNSVLSIEYFVKPPKHSSPKHHHPNAQILYVLKGQLIVETDDEKVILDVNDSVFLEGNEIHKVINPNKSEAIGLDIFVPGRSFDFWKNKF